MAPRRVKKLHFNLTLADVERALAFKQPGLEFCEEDEVIAAKGIYQVHDGPDLDGPLTKYEILIIFPKSYPEDEPMVLETAGEIARIAERHMNTNGSCCTCVWEEWLDTAPDTSVRGFCDGPLHNFFLGQITFEETGEWPFGERSHGSDGVAEAASVLLGFEVDHRSAARYLSVVCAEGPKGHWACPCGSTKKLRECCLEDLIALRKTVDQDLAKRLLQRLKQQVKLEK